MENNFVGAVAAFVIGAAICFGNYRLSDYFIKSKPDKFSQVSVIRQAIQIAYILILFFTAKYTPWDQTYVLVGGVLGITLPMFYFTYRLVKTANGKNKDKKEDENDG